ncbi:MAG: hypothetical protein E7314_00930 [Clostridiales bacterium]|nr:hypothetical protein [Clostridiales bacterium]
MIYLLISTIILTVILFIIYVKGKTKISEEFIPKLNISSDNISICKEMLKIIGNNHTAVENNRDEKSNLSYYNHKKDVIILKVDSSGSSRITQIAHECIHTIQKKTFLKANNLFSNLQIIYFLISLIYIICNEEYELLLLAIELLILVGVVFVKVVIEGDASYRSVNLAKQYLQDKINEKEIEIYIKETSKLIYELMPVYYFNFFSQGIAMIIINIIIALMM